MSSADGAPRERLHPLLVLPLVAVAATTTLLFLGDKSMWIDEVLSVEFTRHGWGRLWEYITQRGEGNMSLYYALLSLWLALGEGEAVVRGLSVLFALGTVPALCALGARLGGMRTGLAAGLLLALNAFFVQFAQETRAYMLVTLLVTWSTLLLVRLVQRGERRAGPWVVYALVSAAAVYAHFFGALVLLAQAVSAVALPPRATPWRGLLGSAAAVAVLVSPLVAYALLRESGQLDWVPRPDAAALVALLGSFAGGRAALAVWSALVLVGAALALRTLRREGRSVHAWGRLLPLCWLVVPVLVAFVFSHVGRPVFAARFLIVALPAFVLLGADGLVRLRPRWLPGVALAALVALSLHGLTHWYTRVQKEDWRGATGFVLSSARPGDALAFFAYFVDTPFDYYRRQLGVPDDHLVRVELASEPYGLGSTLPDPDAELLAALPERHERVWLVLSHDGNRQLGRHLQSAAIQHALRTGYSSVGERDFVGVRVRLYTRPPLRR